jgi:hypothetical protein
MEANAYFLIHLKPLIQTFALVMVASSHFL